jgi:hypothetical protein
VGASIFQPALIQAGEYSKIEASIRELVQALSVTD